MEFRNDVWREEDAMEVEDQRSIQSTVVAMGVTPRRTLNRAKKRQLEIKDKEMDYECYDSFDSIGANLPRFSRAKKQGRRVSGVMREMVALKNIGHNAEVMDMVFRYMSPKDIMKAGSVSSMWYVVACHIFRERQGNSPFLRLWSDHISVDPSELLLINWELHFHEELLANDVLEPQPKPDSTNGGKKEKKNIKPSIRIHQIQSIISVGGREIYEQFVHEEAKLPFRQDHIFAICQNAIVRAPDFSFTESIFERYYGQMVVESLFIPKSNHFTMKGFVVDFSKEEWSEDMVGEKVELDKLDIGPLQHLSSFLVIKQFETPGVLNFLQALNMRHPTAGMLIGDAEEVGFNRMAIHEHPVAVGYSFYCGPGATITNYSIDFMNQNADALLFEMKRQVESKENSFCWIFSHDSRPMVRPFGNQNKDDDGWWSSSFSRPEPPMEDIITKIHKFLPRTPMVGIKSVHPVYARTSPSYSNIKAESSRDFTFGFVLVCFNA